MMEQAKGKTMSNVEWAVVFISKSCCVDLFEDWRSAFDFMREKANETLNYVLENVDDHAYIENCGFARAVYVNGEPEYGWRIMPTNIH